MKKEVRSVNTNERRKARERINARPEQTAEGGKCQMRQQQRRKK